MSEVTAIATVENGGAVKTGFSFGGNVRGKAIPAEISGGFVTFNATITTIETLPGGGAIYTDPVKISQFGLYGEVKNGDSTGLALTFERGIVHGADHITKANGKTVGVDLSTGAVSATIEVDSDTGIVTTTTSYGIGTPGLGVVATAAAVVPIVDTTEAVHSVPNLNTGAGSYSIVNAVGVEMSWMDNLAVAFGAPVAVELTVNGNQVYYVRNIDGSEGLYDPVSGNTNPISTGVGGFWGVPDPVQMHMIQNTAEAVSDNPDYVSPLKIAA